MSNVATFSANEDSKRSRATPLSWQVQLCLFLGSFAYLCSGIYRAIDPYDEGIVLTGSWLVSLGHFPYRDFWTLYGPGQYFCVGALFKLFGSSVELLRLYDACLKALLSLVLFRLSNRLCGNSKAALCAWLLSLLWLERFGRYGYTIFPAMLFTTLCMELLYSESSAERGRAAAICASLAGLFRQDFIPYVVLLALVVDFRRPARFFNFLFISVMTWLICYTALATIASWEEIYSQLIAFPLWEFPKHMALSFPSPSMLLHQGPGEKPSVLDLSWSSLIVYYLPFIVLALYPWSVGWHSTRSSGALLLLPILLLNQARVRSDFAHIFPSLLCSLPLLVAASVPHFGKRTVKGTCILSIGFALVLVLLGTPLKSKIQELSQTRDTHSLMLNKTALDEYDVVRSEMGRCGSKLFILPPLTSDSGRGDVASYFLNRKIPSTKYYEPHPGLYQQQRVRQSLMTTLNLPETQCVLQANPYGEFDTNQDPHDPLVSYINEHFEPLHRGEYYSLLHRKAF